MIAGKNFFQGYSAAEAYLRISELQKLMPVVKNVSPALMALINVLLSPMKVKQCTVAWVCSHRWLVAGVKLPCKGYDMPPEYLEEEFLNKRKKCTRVYTYEAKKK